ncbi:hypothetical protein TI04_02530 [Achromatium sp. WMS2]|nr:hypothetical protein TI04_02530 [Achromatium sp. WMS2]
MKINVVYLYLLDMVNILLFHIQTLCDYCAAIQCIPDVKYVLVGDSGIFLAAFPHWSMGTSMKASG